MGVAQVLLLAEPSGDRVVVLYLPSLSGLHPALGTAHSDDHEMLTVLTSGCTPLHHHSHLTPTAGTGSVFLRLESACLNLRLTPDWDMGSWE